MMAHLPLATQHAQLFSSSSALQHAISSGAGGSATARKDHATNFWENYEHMCAVYNQMPLQSLKAVAIEGGAVLDLNADKLKSGDWDALLGAIKTCKAVRKIALKSAYVGPNESESDVKNGKRLGGGAGSKMRKVPAIRTKERVHKLCRGLKDCLAISQFLDHLEIFNVPLSSKDLASLSKGLSANKTLKLLSLDSCLIGDDGLAIVCESIQRLTNLNRVNFSACNLTHLGADILAKLIIFQAMKRHDEAWKASLRYGRPDLDSMCGIRRITINSNPLIGDKGVEQLADAFKADLWLKALDMQDCGITTKGAECLLEGLKFNAMMHVLDVRLNPLISRDKLQKIMEQVMINSSGNSTEYEWMDLAQTAAKASASLKEPSAAAGAVESGQKLKKRRATNASFSKKLQFVATSSIKMKRCKSTGSVVCAGSTTPSKQTGAAGAHPGGLQNSGSGGGVPWRAAARAERYRVGASCAFRRVNSPGGGHHEADEEEEEEESDEFDEDEFEIVTDKRHQRAARPLLANPQNDHLMMASSTFDYDKFASTAPASFRPRGKATAAAMAAETTSTSDFAASLDKIRNVSVKDLLVILQKEQESKTRLEDMILELQDENTRLKGQIASMRTRMADRNLSRSCLDDDKAVEIIELTLHKFQSFLDFLRERGFGKLIEIGGMNQQASESAEIERQKTRGSGGGVSQMASQEDYYLNKINRTKSKLARQQQQQQKAQQAAEQEHDIDSLVTNALEITHTYKRQNSTFLNASKRPGKGTDYILDQIEESSSGAGGGKANLSDVLQSTDALFADYNGRKLKPTPSSHSNASSTSGLSKQSPTSAAGGEKPATMPRHQLETASKELSGAGGGGGVGSEDEEAYSDEDGDVDEEDYAAAADEEVAKIQKLSLQSPPTSATKVLKFHEESGGEEADEVDDEEVEDEEEEEEDDEESEDPADNF